MGGENPVIVRAGWKRPRLCNQTPTVLKRIFDVNLVRGGELQGLYWRILSAFLTLAMLVRSSYIPLTRYSLWIIIFKFTLSWDTAWETNLKFVGSLMAPKRHLLKVRTVFFGFAELMCSSRGGPGESFQHTYSFSSYICKLKINIDLQSWGDKGKRMAIIIQLLRPTSSIFQSQGLLWYLTHITVVPLHSPTSVVPIGCLRFEQFPSLPSCFPETLNNTITVQSVRSR